MSVYLRHMHVIDDWEPIFSKLIFIFVLMLVSVQYFGILLPPLDSAMFLGKYSNVSKLQKNLSSNQWIRVRKIPEEAILFTSTTCLCICC